MAIFTLLLTISSYIITTEVNQAIVSKTMSLQIYCLDGSLIIFHQQALKPSGWPDLRGRIHTFSLCKTSSENLFAALYRKVIFWPNTRA